MLSQYIWGNSRPDDHEEKIHYSDLVKSVLRRSDRRVAECVNNMFYKLKKVQMQTVRNKVGIAVRKHNKKAQHRSWHTAKYNTLSHLK